MKYSNWAKWFTVSILASIIIAFIGLLPGSKEFAPNWPIYAIICLANLIICAFIGYIHKDKNNNNGKFSNKY